MNNYQALKTLSPGDIVRFRYRMNKPQVDRTESAIIFSVTHRPSSTDRGNLVEITYVPSMLHDACQLSHGLWVAGENDNPRVWGATEIQVIGRAAKHRYLPTPSSNWQPAPGNLGYDLCC